MPGYSNDGIACPIVHYGLGQLGPLLIKKLCLKKFFKSIFDAKGEVIALKIGLNFQTLATLPDPDPEEVCSDWFNSITFYNLYKKNI